MANAQVDPKVKLYALRKTDYGFHGKTTERAITGGYTIPTRDESIVRNVEPKHTVLKAGRMSARPHGGAPDKASVNVTELGALSRIDRNNRQHFKARKLARRAANAARRGGV
jgi:hypothetical protein